MNGIPKIWFHNLKSDNKVDFDTFKHLLQRRFKITIDTIDNLFSISHVPNESVNIYLNRVESK